MENKNVDITKQSEVTCVEWFHGYGGNALGLKRVIPGLRSVAVCERDAFVVANMVSKMEKGLLDAVPIWTDVTDFPTEPFGYQQLDFFAASYPCQGFSHAGKRLGTEDPRHLWPYCRKFIQHARPGWVWLENVEGHITLGLSTVLADLEEDGYKAAWGIFSASEVGAPHQRKRVFILAHQFNEGLQGHSGNVNGEGREPRGEGRPVTEGGVCGESDTRRELDNSMQRGCERLGQMEAGRAAPDLAGEAWPSRPGQAQHGWEPPRVVGNSNGGRSASDSGLTRSVEQEEGRGENESDQTGKCRGQVKSPLGGNPDGPADGLDFPGCTGLDREELEEIYGWMVKGTNRTDELRMCGNGVVPQTAERAFRVLYRELTGY